MSRRNVNLQTQNAAALATNDDSSTQFSYLSAESIELYDPATQQEIKKLADEIDVTLTDKVTAYAGTHLKKSINDNMQFLERMMGTEEDRQLVKHIGELSAKVNNEANDIKIVAKEKNIFARFLDFIRGADERDDTIKKISSCFKLMGELEKAMQEEINIVTEREKDAENNTKYHIDAVTMIEKYLVAGYIACERIEAELNDLKASSSIMIADQVKCKNLSEGLINFKMVLQNLEKSRTASAVAIMQTVGAGQCLTKLKINFNSTMNNILLIFSQQSSSALLNYTVKNAIDSHKNINKLNAEMMKENSELTALNFNNVAQLVTEGIASADDMKKCAEIIIEGAQKANETITNYIEHLDEDKQKLSTALDYMNNFLGESGVLEKLNSSNSSGSSTSSSSTSSNSLKF